MDIYIVYQLYSNGGGSIVSARKDRNNAIKDANIAFETLKQDMLFKSFEKTIVDNGNDYFLTLEDDYMSVTVYVDKIKLN